jgi:hypothetical protein
MQSFWSLPTFRWSSLLLSSEAKIYINSVRHAFLAVYLFGLLCNLKFWGIVFLRQVGELKKMDGVTSQTSAFFLYWPLWLSRMQQELIHVPILKVTCQLVLTLIISIDPLPRHELCLSRAVNMCSCHFDLILLVHVPQAICRCLQLLNVWLY